MTPVKDKKTGKWQIQFWYKNSLGENKKTTKRSFNTKREAEEWYMNFKLSQRGSLNMTFEAFLAIYKNDIYKKIRESTQISKENMINEKILPYFKDKKMNELQAKDIIAWHNILLDMKDKNGKPYAPTYLRSIHSQLSAILNHAVKFYGLSSNPANAVGSIGSKKRSEITFWQKEEYLKFAETMMDKPLSYYAFEVLYWCGLREGELLALTRADIDLQNAIIDVN